jgi:nucleoid-associated protein YgaU
MRRLMTALGGLLALLVLLVGVPIVLWHVGKGLLPDHVPSVSEALASLAAQDTGQLFLGVVLAIAVIAWLIMVIGFLVEVPAALQRRRGRRVRGLGWAQRSASVLLFMVISGSTTGLLSTAANAAPPPLPTMSAASYTSVVSSAMGTSPAAQTVSTPKATTPTAAHVSGKRTDRPTYVVRKGDTSLWSIAERLLGNGERSTEILSLNAGHVQADGGTLTSTTFPKLGWVLTMPSDAKTDPVPAAAPPAVTAARSSAVETVKVRPGDTLSAIAQRELGDASLYPKLAAKNHISNPGDVEAGETIVIPASTIQRAQQAAEAVTVQPGDTLSSIAQRELGDASLYPKLAVKNHISNPDDIEEGETIVIPAAPSTHPAAPTHIPLAAPAVHPAKPHSTPAAAPHSSAPVVAPHVMAPAAPRNPFVTTPKAPTQPRHASPPEVAAPGAPSVTVPPTPARPASPGNEQVPVGVGPMSPPTSAPAPTTSAHDSVTIQAATDSDADQGMNTVALIGMSAAAAAAVWGGLVLARRRSNRRRRPGRQMPVASLPAIRIEKSLRDRAAEVDVAWLDLALRSLGSILADHPEQVPDITAARLGEQGLRLQLATAQPAPAPFITDGNNWMLPAGAELPINASTAVDQLTPLPTLTSIGSLNGETVLVDLERLGSVGLQGDPAACRGLLNHMATELAHQSWSDGINVTLVGWGAELVPLNPDRLTYAPSIQTATRGLAARVDEIAAALTALDTDVVSARAGDVAGDSWTPQVLLIDATDVPAGEVEALNEHLAALGAAGRAATAVVLTGGPATAAPVAAVQLTADGKLTLSGVLGNDQLDAASLSLSELEGLIDLFENAEQVDEVIPASTVDAPWAQHMDDSGALIPAVILDEPVEVFEATRRVPEQIAAELVLGRAVRPSDEAKLAAVLAADPTLDADLEEWYSETITRPRIGVLGPAQILASGNAPKGRPRWFTEVVVYLALHRRGVSLEKFTRDLWPSRVAGEARKISANTRAETATKVRSWLGVDPDTGLAFMPYGTDKSYRLVDRLFDLELLQRLRERGDAKAGAAAPTALDDYVAALKLVRGPILPEAHQAGRSGPAAEMVPSQWSWLSNPDRREDISVPGWVVDACHRTVQVALALGDLDRARWAANVGHDTDINADVPLLDLLVIAAQAGDMATANRHAWAVVEAHGQEDPEDLPSETFNIINRIFPTGLRAVSN